LPGFYCDYMHPPQSSRSDRCSEIAVEDKTSYYDSLFLAAAEREEMPLLTLDRKLYEKAKAKRDVFAWSDGNKSANLGIL
jgi:predicted nucleic acid-binding protein